MTIIGLIVTLVVIGVLLWLVNTHLGGYIDGKILRIINVVVVVLVILWLLQVFVGGFGVLSQPVPRVR